ncbi:PKD domain-containing protein [Candidatus Peregrinibacteria bacterium]|nr:MAG: PKD domain-containing protein [Candidatus Peregrinibacteria bacterium]
MIDPEKKENESLFQKMMEEEVNNVKNKTHTEEATKKLKKSQKLKKGEKRRVSPIALFIGVFLLFLILIALLIFLISYRGSDNPVLQFFGQDEYSVREFLKQVVNASFGFLSVILLLTISISLFFGLSQPKENAGKKRASFLFSLSSFGLQIITIIAWIGMFEYVSAISVPPPPEQEEIAMKLPNGEVLYPPIAPEKTEFLVAPVNIDFSAKNIVAAFERQGSAIRSIEWDPTGEGKFISEGLTPSFRITKTGIRTVSLRILFEDGNELEKNISFTIPQGTFQANPSTGGIPLEVEFDASTISEDIPDVEYFEWDFDDKTSIQETRGPKVLHTFERIGNYEIVLHIFDRYNRVYTFSKTITTTKKPDNIVQAHIETIPQLPERGSTITTGTEIEFSGEKSESIEGSITKYEWSFSDTSKTQSRASIKRKFSSEGFIEVTLTTQDSAGNIGKSTIGFTVVPEPSRPVPIITTLPKAENSVIRGRVPLLVSFDAKETLDTDGDVVSYEWDFDGDKKTDIIGENGEYTYRIPGKYVATLTVQDKEGYVEQAEQQIEVDAQEMQAAILTTPDPPNTEVPCEFQFDGSPSFCGNETCRIDAYNWDFGDGNKNQFTSAKTAHVYRKIGAFPVVLTIFSGEKTASANKTVYCRERGLRACFNATQLSGKTPLSVRFDPTCSEGGVITNWQWDFGDGTTSDERIPSEHVFQKPGQYSVTLSVTDENQNIDRQTATIYAE